MDAVIKLIESADFPEREENDVLRNFQSSCPPEVRNVAAFRAISNSLHVTGHFVRERMLVLTAGGALCREDKNLRKSYDSLFHSQLMGDTKKRSQVLHVNEDGRITGQTGDIKRESLKTIISFRKIKQTPLAKLKIANPTVLPIKKRSTFRKASILKNVFRRNSNTARRRSAQMQLLKACCVKLMRLPEKINLNHVGFSKPPRKQKINEPKKLKPNTTNLSKNLKPSKISVVQKSLNHLHFLTVQNTSEKLLNVEPTATVTSLVKLNEASPPPVNAPPLAEVVFTESNNDKVEVNESQKTITNSASGVRKSVTEFNIFECRKPPKKQHIRPVIYDEVYRRRLSIVTSDDEKKSNPGMVITTTNSTVTLTRTPLPEKSIITTKPKIKKKSPEKTKRRTKSTNLKHPSKHLVEKTNDISQSLPKSANGKRKYSFWRDSSEEPGNLQQAKIVDAKQNGKFFLENDFLSQPLKNFRIPFSFHLASSTEHGEVLGKGRRESYHCHWDKFTERKKSLIETSIASISNEKVEHNHHYKKAKWFDNADLSVSWRKSNQPYPNQLPHPGYSTWKNPDTFPTNGMTTTIPFSKDFTGIEKFSSEVTTSNLISDAINQECSGDLERVDSPKEIIYALGDEYVVSNDVHGTTQSQSPLLLGSSGGGKVTAEVYVNYSDFNFSTSMFVDDAPCYEEFDYEVPAM